jgi:acyl-CoA thioesterase FadM
MAAETTHVHQVDVPNELLEHDIVLQHPGYLVLAERARAAAFLELRSPVDEMWSHGFTLVVRRISVDYVKPIFAGARITIVTSLKVASESAVDVKQRFFMRSAAAEGDRDLPTGSAVCELQMRLVCANVVERRVDALPPGSPWGVALLVSDENLLHIGHTPEEHPWTDPLHEVQFERRSLTRARVWT